MFGNPSDSLTSTLVKWVLDSRLIRKATLFCINIRTKIIHLVHFVDKDTRDPTINCLRDENRVR